MPTRRIDRRSGARFTPSLTGSPGLSARARRCRRRFLRWFPDGFQDATYLDWERERKWDAHERWCEVLRRAALQSLLDCGEYTRIARHALAIGGRLNILSSFEVTALRDAVATRDGARRFAEGLWTLLYGTGSDQARFESWCSVLGELPRRHSRVLTWPTATIWAFVARPEQHLVVKPMVVRPAASEYGFAIHYSQTPNWATYVSILEFAEQVREDQRDLGPRDMIDLQAFIWVQGSDEFEA